MLLVVNLGCLADSTCGPARPNGRSNVHLHEWQYTGQYRPEKSITDEGVQEEKEPTENVLTWVFEENNFVPAAKIINRESYSVVSDYIGRPTHSYDETGKLVWERELDIYGAVRKENGEKGLVPQLYQGQYIDEETGLAYNRFRFTDIPPYFAFQL